MLKIIRITMTLHSTEITKTITSEGLTTATTEDYYNKYGQLIRSESVSGDTTLTTTYEYDYLGRVTKETDPNGNETTYNIHMTDKFQSKLMQKAIV